MSLSMDFGKALGHASSLFSPTQFSLFAQIQEARINDKPVDIEFMRAEMRLPTQTVRIEFHDTTPSGGDSESGIDWLKRGIIYGVRGHPEIDDLDVREWDTFTMDKQEYTVVHVNKQVEGQVQAEFEATG